MTSALTRDPLREDPAAEIGIILPFRYIPRLQAKRAKVRETAGRLRGRIYAYSDCLVLLDRGNDPRPTRNNRANRLDQIAVSPPILGRISQPYFSRS